MLDTRYQTPVERLELKVEWLFLLLFVLLLHLPLGGLSRPR